MGNFLEKTDELGVAGCKRIFWAGVAERGKLGRLGNALRSKVCECLAVPDREREGHGDSCGCKEGRGEDWKS